MRTGDLTSPRVVVVEDDDGMRALVRAQLEAAGWEVAEATEAAAAPAAVRAHDPDLVVADLGLPQPEVGLGLISALHPELTARGVPLIVLTGEDDPGRLSDALGRGAHDYVVKPITALELQARCAAALRIKRIHDRLQVEAVTDPLTGLLNRRAGMAELRRALAANVRHDRRTAVLMIDLDGFKEVNDEFGHTEGDRLLKALAAALAEQTRDEDLLVRWGGDEFVLIIPECEGHAAKLAGHRLLEAAAGVGVGLSIGCALAEPGDGTDELVARADEALYVAKRSGGARLSHA